MSKRTFAAIAFGVAVGAILSRAGYEISDVNYWIIGIPVLIAINLLYNACTDDT